MKYGKRWKLELSKLPIDVQTKCFSYKRWKSKCKNLKSQEQELLNSTLQELIHETKRVDTVFKHFMNVDTTFVTSLFGLLLPCFENLTKDKIQESHKLAYKYATLNAECLSKICKRADRYCSSCRFVSWLVNSKNSFIYSFLGGREMAALHIRFKEDISDECPICLDPLLEKTIIILECGHILCMDCAKSILRVPIDVRYHMTSYMMRYYQQKNGRMTMCPCCRCDTAFTNVTIMRHK